jgi:hypothetical protein
MMGKRPSGPGPTTTRKQVTAMIHPSDQELTHPIAVRDGQGAPVTCAACGCRLASTGDVWFHYNPIAGRDARGCRIACADAAHDATGRPVSLAV